MVCSWAPGWAAGLLTLPLEGLGSLWYLSHTLNHLITVCTARPTFLHTLLEALTDKIITWMDFDFP